MWEGGAVDPRTIQEKTAEGSSMLQLRNVKEGEKRRRQEPRERERG